MKNIAIYGTGGFGREVVQLIEEINLKSNEWNIVGFIDDNLDNIGNIVNGYPVLGDYTWLTNHLDREINVAIGIGSPKTKRKIHEKLKDKKHIIFPNIIHPDVKLSRFIELGQGNIICEGSILTCNITIGSFVTINLNCTVGHDCIIEDFCTISPNASISGNVCLQEGVDFGTNATIIQGLTVGAHTIIGAGAVVSRDIPAHCTAVGVPARAIKFHNEE